MASQGSAINSDDLTEMASLKHWGSLPASAQTAGISKSAVLNCGWGRLLFGQTFADSDALADEIQKEKEGQRDVALYVRDPHIVLARAPHALFLDPSNTFRLNLTGDQEFRAISNGVVIEEAQSKDLRSVNRIYQSRNMVPLEENYLDPEMKPRSVVVLVARDALSGDVLGVVMGIDHACAFNDPDNGSSLWALAVDTQARMPGVGIKLVQGIAEQFQRAGRSFLDLSVMYTNSDAIDLYQKLGFEQVPVYCIKKKNTVNEKLFIGPEPEVELNIYAQIVVDEARRRGISVEIEDSKAGLLKLSHGGRSISCRESLSDLTSAVAMSRCDDKALTRRLLAAAGLSLPAQHTISADDDALAFLETYKRVVVKPARGEQGRAVFVDLTTPAEVVEAISVARKSCDTVLIEEFISGQDVRIIVIGGKVVAAALRKPASVVGDGVHTIMELIDKQSRRRAAATRGESTIPIDEETARTVRMSGYRLHDVLSEGVELAVRKTANLHTGGLMQDVTSELAPELAEAAVRAAEVLQIPLVGLDFLITAPDQPEYYIIEANERPGLANHEPAPTAEKFIDLLFPETRARTP